jgi:uncharacterized damage-inducible protein DinB
MGWSSIPPKGRVPFMTQKTASEKDLFLQAFERERATTLKVLKAYPADQVDFKPHERSKSARELAWMFVVEQSVLGEGALKGKLEFSGSLPEPPATMNEIIEKFENASRETIQKVRAVNEDDMNGMMQFMAGPKTMIDQRRFDVLWLSLMDQVHHRGQFSVYLRMAGGKVPSIYGPTADEPWT